jgi:hypothetical protein
MLLTTEAVVVDKPEDKCCCNHGWGADTGMWGWMWMY